MQQRHECLSGSTKTDRDWWIVTRLVALTVVCALVSADVFWLPWAGRAPPRSGRGLPSGRQGTRRSARSGRFDQPFPVLQPLLLVTVEPAVPGGEPESRLPGSHVGGQGCQHGPTRERSGPGVAQTGQPSGSPDAQGLVR